MSASSGRPAESRVLLLPATHRDAQVVGALLERTGLQCLVCGNASQLVAAIKEGAGLMLLTDSGLAGPEGALILDALQRQPPWSDLPVVILGSPDASDETRNLADRMTNVTLLDRPTSSRVLLSAIRTSLRARLRQYQMRDQVAALHAAEVALRNGDRRKDEFLAMLAHELRNPLAPIRTAADLLPLIVPAGNERVDVTLRVVKRQVAQLARLVDDLLDVSRITQGRIQLRHETIDLTAVVAQALESVEPLMADKRHQLLRPQNPPVLHVRGDRARLVQCVSNVLANAAKYTDAGGTIQVELQQQGPRAVIAVQDNGIGLSADLLLKIFDLFVQSERSLERAQGGLGIGLSIVRRLVEMHGGEVQAFSQGTGRGSRFEIRLPLVPAPESQALPPPGVARRTQRVLIVDDNRDAAESLSLLLQFHGHEVQVAYEGEAALQLADRFRVELVLLDIGLPGMNGYEVARRLRSTGCSARLVAVTGYGQPEDLKLAREAGFDAHLIKPVELEQVLAVLHG